MTLRELKERYINRMHAVQSGIAMMMNYDPAETQPKHLRMGVNSALIESGAIIALLLRKKVFTEEEFYAEVLLIAERDVKSYEDMISTHLGGKKVTLA